MRLTVTSFKDMLDVARGGRAIPNAYKKSNLFWIPTEPLIIEVLLPLCQNKK